MIPSSTTLIIDADREESQFLARCREWAAQKHMPVSDFPQRDIVVAS